MYEMAADVFFVCCSYNVWLLQGTRCVLLHHYMVENPYDLSSPNEILIYFHLEC
jgi:hypothetical protein